MKKNGFLATSVLYSFFLSFCILMAGLLANYTHQTLIFDKSSKPLTYEEETFYLTVKLPAMYGYSMDQLEALGLTFDDIILENNVYTIQIPVKNLSEEKILDIYGDRYTISDDPNYYSFFNTDLDTQELIGINSETDTCKIVSTVSDNYEDYTQVKLQVNSKDKNLECDLTDTNIALLFDMKLDGLTDSLATKIAQKMANGNYNNEGFVMRSYETIDNEMYMMNKINFKYVLTYGQVGSDACIFNQGLQIDNVEYTGNANNYFTMYNNAAYGCLEFNINKLYPIKDKKLGTAHIGCNRFAPSSWKVSNVLMPVYNSDSDEEIRIWDFQEINGAYNVGYVTASSSILTVYSTTRLDMYGSYIDFDSYEYLGSNSAIIGGRYTTSVYAYNIYLNEGDSGVIYVYYGRACSGCENWFDAYGLDNAFDDTRTYYQYNEAAKYTFTGYKGGHKEIYLIQSEHSAPGGDDDYIYVPEFDEDGDWIQG